MFKTTADSQNRIQNKEKVEREHPGLTEEGNEKTEFIYQGQTIAKGYTRVVYGDHGPYIEFEDKHINWKLFNIRKKSPYAWYDEAYFNGLMLYIQKKDVSMLPNPPAGKYSVRNNRKEGYADYKINMIYVDPDKIKIKTGE